MRIQPEVPDLFFLFAKMVGDTGGDARRYGVITAKNQRKKTLAQCFFSSSRDIAAGLGNLLHIFGALFADRHFFRLLHRKIADVFHLKTQLLDAGLQPRATKRGRAHIDAPAALPQIHRYPDDANFLRHVLSVTRCS